MVSVYRVGDQNAITVSETIHDYVEQARARMPEGIAIEVWKDDASFLRGRIDLLLRNAANGLGLVVHRPGAVLAYATRVLGDDRDSDFVPGVRWP